MNKKKGRKSHIIPEVYLKGFTKKSNDRLFRLKKKLEKYIKPEEKHPAAVCYQRGFYEFNKNIPLEGYYINEPDLLEDFGFPYENRLRKLIDKVIAPTQMITMQEATDLSIALFDLKLRTEYYRESAYSDQQINSVIDRIIVDHESQKDNPGHDLFKRGYSFDQIKIVTEILRQEWLENKLIRKELHNRSLLESKFQPSLVKQTIYNNLINGQWAVYKSDLNHPFITSDNPGFCMDEQNHIHNTKFSTNNFFCFPLNSYNTLGIFMDSNYPTLNSVKVIKSIHASKAFVEMINRSIWHFAHKEVYAAHESTLERVWNIEKSFS